MPSRDHIRYGFLRPADIEVAQRAFDRLCAIRAIKASSDEGAELAATVIAFFQQGLISEDDLVAEISAMRPPGPVIAAA